MVVAVQYRIEISTSREGVARIHLPGRSLELEASADDGGWRVAVVDPQRPSPDAANIVALRAASANDAVWRVARAAVRAVSELTQSPLDDELRHDP
jgi:hypothetical protein